MKKSSASLRNLGTYTSPATPEYDHVRGYHKGWNSERVPLSNNSSRGGVSSTALMPFNSGRTVPSKWDNAERWITSPVSGYGVWKPSNVQLQRHPKSKSGPLGAPGLMYLPNYSPVVPVLEGGLRNNFIANSPFTTGVLVPDGVSFLYGSGTSANSSALYAENSMAQISSVPGLSDLFSESSIPSSQDDTTKDPDSASCVVSRRDMATQMSPDSSTHGSPKKGSSSIPSGVERNMQHSAKDEIRDVQVDKGAPISGESQKSRVTKQRKELPDVTGSTSPWGVADTAKSASRSQREEARITAWENLQKAKAEAAIQKLEMKLEKRRSASMDKILNKLRFAQLKAQEKRRAISEGQLHQSQRNSQSTIQFRKNFKIASFTSCFVCRIR